MADGEIVRVLVSGVAGPDGKPIKVSEATARRDLAAISDEFRGIFDSDDAIEREIGAAFQRYKLIGTKAMGGKRPNYHAAIAATDRVVKIAASRSDRWGHLAGTGRARGAQEVGPAAPLVAEGDAELVARAQELMTKPLDELRTHHRRLRERMDELGLTLEAGGELPKAAGAE